MSIFVPLDLPHCEDAFLGNTTCEIWCASKKRQRVDTFYKKNGAVQAPNHQVLDAEGLREQGKAFCDNNVAYYDYSPACVLWIVNAWPDFNGCLIF